MRLPGKAVFDEEVDKAFRGYLREAGYRSMFDRLTRSGHGTEATAFENALKAYVPALKSATDGKAFFDAAFAIDQYINTNIHVLEGTLDAIEGAIKSYLDGSYRSVEHTTVLAPLADNALIYDHGGKHFKELSPRSGGGTRSIRVQRAMLPRWRRGGEDGSARNRYRRHDFLQA